MRILGFDHHWPKLDQPEFTTFRFPRKDADRGRDWAVGETVQCVVQQRASFTSGKREHCGIAEIVDKKLTRLTLITTAEAVEDGFDDLEKMVRWMEKSHRGIALSAPINKLTLQRVEVAQ